MSEIKALEKLRESFDDCTQEAGIEPNTFDTVWITKSCAIAMLDEIKAEVDERFMELRDKSRKERVYWQNEIHAILDMLNGKERFWGACMEYPIDEYTVPPSETARQELERKYMRLPVDADGVPIRVGDVVKCTFADDNATVKYLSLQEDGWSIVVDYPNGRGHRTPESMRHVKPRTLEDVLQDAGVSVAAITDVAAEIRELLGVDA